MVGLTCIVRKVFSFVYNRRRHKVHHSKTSDIFVDCKDQQSDVSEDDEEDEIKSNNKESI